MSQPTETDEWLAELVDGWTEVYKKSMTTVVLLRIIDAKGPIDAAAIAPEMTDATGWQLTERGLYRTLRRLAGSGLLVAVEEPAARTGAKRKLFKLSDLGRDYRTSLEERLIQPGRAT